MSSIVDDIDVVLALDNSRLLILLLLHNLVSAYVIYKKTNKYSMSCHKSQYLTLLLTEAKLSCKQQ